MTITIYNFDDRIREIKSALIAVGRDPSKETINWTAEQYEMIRHFTKHTGNGKVQFMGINHKISK